MFDENFSYDDHKIYFLRHCMQNLTVFWIMYKLQQKGKENLKRIN